MANIDRDPLASFSTEAQMAMVRATQEALDARSDIVYTTHMLLGIMGQSESRSWSGFFASEGISCNEFRSIVEELPGGWNPSAEVSRLKLSDETEIVIKNVFEQNKQGRAPVGLDELAMEILKVPSSDVTLAFRKMGLNQEKLTARLQERLERSSEPHS